MRIIKTDDQTRFKSSHMYNALPQPQQNCGTQQQIVIISVEQLLGGNRFLGYHCKQKVTIIPLEVPDI